MGDKPWVKFYPSDWLAGTSGLSAAERGVYITIVALIYEAEGPIALDEPRLARRCGVTKAAFTKILRALTDEGKLNVVGGKLTNRRAETELSARGIRVEKARSSASDRWRAQRDKGKENQWTEDANASAKQCSLDASQSQSQIGVSATAATPRRSEQAQSRGDDDPRSWTDDRLLDEVMAAVGLTGASIPTYWLPPAATLHVGRWRRDLDIPPDRIVEAARQSRARHPEPPSGPKALDGTMRRLAAELKAEPMQAEAPRPRPPSGNGQAPPETKEARRQRWAKIVGRPDDDATPQQRRAPA